MGGLQILHKMKCMVVFSALVACISVSSVSAGNRPGSGGGSSGNAPGSPYRPPGNAPYRPGRDSWIRGPQGSGDCDRICSDNASRCSEGMGQRAAANNRIIERSTWYRRECKGYNAWDYGQGFSECTDPACCLDGSCQNHCSITSSWPGCGDIGNFNGHHSRICPCEFLAPPPPPPPGRNILYQF